MKVELERRAARQTRVFVIDVDYFDERAAGLVAVHAAAVAPALAQIREWHPKFDAATDDDIRRAAFDLDDARLVYARQHGCADWPALLAHVESVASGARREPFRDAFEAARTRQWDALTAVIERHPEVLRQRGTNGNTLMNLAVSLAADTCGPRSSEGPRWLDLLLDAGADFDTANDRGWTPLHQAAYANQPQIAARLVAAGAAVDREAHGDGGTPLAVALFWGNREAADVLAAVAVVPNNLRMAAALGRVDLVEAAFAPDGELTAESHEGRGFYRPHSGFPLWHPTGDRQEILDEALVWAAKADRVEVMPLLVARGADVNGDPYRGTPLSWAAFKSRLAAAVWLLDHGADVNRRATFGGPGHGAGLTALHLAAQSDHVEMARLLLERGADATIKDALYEGTASSWAGHFGAARVQALFKSTGQPSIERGGAGMPEENPLDLIRKRTIVYRVPEMDAVSVRRDLEYMSASGEPRTLDLYLPTHQEGKRGMPALVFVMGYPDAGMKAMLGCNAKEMGHYSSWARLAAASGMIGVTYSAQAPASETLAVLRYLRENARSLNLDPERIGIWSCSGNVPNALGVLASEAPGAIRCAVLCYGLMLDLDGSTIVADAAKQWRFVTPAAGRSVADLPSETPLFIARAGRDEFAGLNDTIDTFVAAALALDRPIMAVNHPGAPHSFDAILDDEPTRELIRRMIAFLRFHLAC